MALSFMLHGRHDLEVGSFQAAEFLVNVRDAGIRGYGDRSFNAVVGDNHAVGF